MMGMIFLRMALLGGALALLAACLAGVPAQPSLRPIAVQLAWNHQAQFAGIYAADRAGLYAAEGLAVTVLPGGPGVDKLAPVLSGAAQFGVAGADELILARAAGQPVRAIATIYRRSPIVFVALAETGITRPEEFAGKTIRVADNLVPSLHAMLAHVGVAPDQYQVVTELPSDLALFASGEVPVWGMYINGMYVAVQRAGYPVNLIFPDDYGVHFYADTLYTTDELIDRDPELVRRFLRATLSGWTYAIENPGDIASLVASYAPDADLDVEHAKMIASLPLVNTGEDHIGWMRPDQWETMAQALHVENLLAAPLEISQVYTLQFLEENYTP